MKLTRKHARTRVTCSCCGKKNLIRRWFYDAETKKGTKHFFCNKLCKREFLKKNEQLSLKKGCYLAGAKKLEKKLYADMKTDQKGYG